MLDIIDTETNRTASMPTHISLLLLPHRAPKVAFLPELASHVVLGRIWIQDTISCLHLRPHTLASGQWSMSPFKNAAGHYKEGCSPTEYYTALSLIITDFVEKRQKRLLRLQSRMLARTSSDTNPLTVPEEMIQKTPLCQCFSRCRFKILILL
jgi:hypothetical protein